MKKNYVLILAVVLVIGGVFGVWGTRVEGADGFSVGNNVRVIVNITSSLQVRESPKLVSGENPITRKIYGDLGAVVGGPVYSGGYRWWDIYWVDGARGWSADVSQDGSEFYLERVNQPIIVSLAGPVSLTAGQSYTWNMSSYDGGYYLLYSVDWGDKASTTQNYFSFTHTYLKTGTYTAKFTVSGMSNGAVVGSMDKSITISVTGSDISSGKFRINDKVKVTGDYLQVRLNASLAGNANGFRMTGDLGTIIEGPWSANGYIWWKINYDTGIDGWSVENWLEVVSGGGTTTSTSTITLTSPNFKRGDRAVSIGWNLNVRPTPSGSQSSLGQKNFSERGEITDGPVSAEGYTWWKVRWEDGLEGWSAGAWLQIQREGFASPAKGEVWQVGTTKNIVWRPELLNKNFSDVVSILASPLGPSELGGDWHYVVKDIENSGSYSWSIQGLGGDLEKLSDGLYGIAVFSQRSYCDGSTFCTALSDAIFSDAFSISSGGGGTPTSTTTSTVPTNSPPLISDVTGPTSLTAGTTGTWIVTASDPNLDALSYSAVWGDGTTSVAQSGSILYHSYTTAGTYQATFTVSDGKGGSANKTVTIIVGGGTTPTSTVQASNKFSVGDKIRVTAPNVQVRDIFSAYTPSLGVKNTGDTGVVVGGPKFTHNLYWWWQIDYDNNGEDGWSDGNWLEKIGSGGTITNKPPVISDVASPASVFAGAWANWTVSASDPDADAFSYSVIWGDGATGTQGPRFQHTYAAAGSYTATFTVVDSRGGSASKTVVVQVVTLTPSTRFIIGDRVRAAMYSSDGVVDGDVGTVIGGPEFSSIGYWRWQVNFDKGLTSWTAEIQLTKINLTNATTSTLPTSTRFTTGDKIKTTGKAQVRTTAGGTLLGNRAIGDKGTIIGGPEYAIVSGVGYWWWNINYDTRSDGWSVEDWLVKIGSTSVSTSTPPTNQPPVSLTINGLSTVTANVPSSWTFAATDPEGKTLTYKVNWGDSSSEVEATGVVSGASKSFTHNYAPSGRYTITFTATDDKGLTTTKTAMVQAVHTDPPPISTRFMGGDKIQTTGKVQVRTTAGGTLLRNRAIGDKGAIIGGPQYAVVSGVGYWWWNINYDTGIDGWSAENWLVKIGSTSVSTSTPPGNLSPSTPIITGPTSLTIGQNGIWTVKATDPENSQISYMVNWEAGDIVSNYSGASGIPVSVTRTYGQAGTKMISVTAIDAQGLRSYQATYNVNVTQAGGAATSTPPTNQPPVIYGVTGPTSLTAGAGGTWTVSVSDPDSDPLMYSVNWGDGATSPAQSGSSFTHTYTTAGNYTARFTASDGKGGVVNSDKVISVSVPGGGTPTSTITVTSPTAGEVWRVGETHTVRWVAPASTEGVSLDFWLPIGFSQYIVTSAPNTGSYTFVVPDMGYTRSDYIIELRGVWGYSVDSAPFTILGAVGSGGTPTSTATSTPPTNQAPVISGVTSPASLIAGTASTWTVTASDPDNDTLSYSVVWGDGQTGSAQNGSSFTHTYATAGFYSVTFTLADGKGGNATKVLTVTAGSANLPTLSDITGPTSLKVNTRGDWEVAISNPGGYSLSYIMDWGDGAKISGSVGTAGYSGMGFNHTYATARTYTMTFTVTKSTGESVSKSLTVAATLAMASPTASYTASAIQAIQLQLNQVVEQLRLILEQLR